MSEIYILRPWAFVFILPVILFCLYRTRSFKTWFSVIDSHLLEALTFREAVNFRSVTGFVFLLAVSSCTVFALAGVSWRKEEIPLYQAKSPAVIVLDLSLSMRVRDIPPNRFSQAVFKTYDLLKRLKGMPLGLVVFSDEPYSLIPTTTDTGVLEAVMPLLNFNLMPSQGSRIDRALDEVGQMLSDSGAQRGDIFLITDGADEVLSVQDKAIERTRQLAEQGNRLFVLGVGTRQGGSLMQKDDMPVTDRLGNPVRHQLKDAFLKKLAVTGNGAYASVSVDGSDIDFLIQSYERIFQEADLSDITDKNKTADKGYWFLILPLCFFPFLFRKGQLVLVFLLFSIPAEASVFNDLFLNTPAKVMKILNQGEEEKAIQMAVESNNFKTLYNAGTALIARESYNAAVKVLTLAVALKPENKDALINLEIAQRLAQSPPPEENTPPSENENAPDNPEDSGEKEGNSQGSNNLNQNDNNSSQDNENKENNMNNTENESFSGSSAGQNEPESGSSDLDSGNVNAAASGNSNAGEGSSGESKEKGLPKITDDPAALLKRKIMFLYLNKRYPEETIKGAEW